MAKAAWLGVVLIAVLGCTAPAPERAAGTAVERAPQSGLRVEPKALCVQPPRRPGPLGGYVGPMWGDPWSPRCVDGYVIAPCELGVLCDRPGRCSCACETDGDCRDMIVGLEALSLGASGWHRSVCETGTHGDTCVWIAPEFEG